MTDDFLFDIELVDNSVRTLKCGKAAGLDGLTAEHIIYCHPALCSILYRLFNAMISFHYVPSAFGLSYTVPLPKSNCSSFSKSLSTDDFRGISISCIISKIFEKCILNRFDSFLQTSDHQFGFKRSLGCSDAIYTVNCIVHSFVENRSTVNLAALDIRKAFDKMSHYCLFIKLMNRMLPNDILFTLEFWFLHCSTCVRWGNIDSQYIVLKCGVRQGGVLSPYLFALCLDDVVKNIYASGLGCHIGIRNISIILYADDILLLAPSLCALQNLVVIIESYLHSIDMALNPKKSVCLRIGPHYKDQCAPIITSGGDSLSWVTSLKYLGVVLQSSKKFKVSISDNKKSFYRASNSIYSRIGRHASEEVICKLIDSKCVPALLCGLEATPPNISTISRSLDFICRRTLMKIFKTRSVDIVNKKHTYRCRSARAFGCKPLFLWGLPPKIAVWGPK